MQVWIFTAFLRLPPEDYIFSADLMKNVVSQLKEILIEMESKGKIKLSKQIHFDNYELIADGINHLGVYHPEKPILINKKGELISKDFKLLYFYHNRLENYGLAQQIDWTKKINEENFMVVEG